MQSTLLLLLLVASVVAVIAARIRVPYTVALVAAGLLLRHLSWTWPGLPLHGLRLTPHLLMDFFLPVLLFEAAFHLSFNVFFKNIRIITLLAFPGVLLATAIAATLSVYLGRYAGINWGWGVALLFASMLAATDPVSVIALFKELGAPKRLSVVMEGESLLNDGVAVVLFTVLAANLSLGHTEHVLSFAWVSRFFAWEVLGGLGLGAVIGLLVSYLLTFSDDRLVEITLSTVAVFASHMFAGQLHVSGVLAVVAAGMACGNVGAKFGLSERSHEAVAGFWEYAVFVSNSFVFLLIGEEINLRRLGSHLDLVVFAWLSLLIGRFFVVWLVKRSVQRSKEQLPTSWTAVLSWGGLRGGLSMVLALGLPADFAYRKLLIDLVFGVVLFSIVIQGLSIPSVLKWACRRTPESGS
ncbi:MAG: sodium:proton antiporter [Myxococcales bacterium]|nr:MAG: sodium:proton antiporter [Myxococcales bacterium]